MALTISQLGTEVGISADAIRFYEREGLLPEPERTASGYRVYGPDQVERLRFIKGAQRLGLRLREIRELLKVRDRGLCPCGHTEAMVRERLVELDAELSRLTELRKELVRLTEYLSREECPPGETWICGREFIEAGR